MELDNLPKPYKPETIKALNISKLSEVVSVK